MIVAVNEQNFKQYATLFAKLFPNAENSEKACKELVESGKEHPFLYLKNGQAAGFISLSVRKDYVNGTKTSPVVFVEGVFVEKEFRRQKIGRMLMDYARAYAKARGIAEVASDCNVDNKESEAFHKAAGFSEQERVICFTATVN